MKIIKYLLLLLIILLAGSVAYIALLNDTYEVEKEWSLKAPRELVFEKVNNIKSWEEWFFTKDPHYHYTISENTSGENAWFSWVEDSLKTEGKLTTKQITHSSSIEQQAYQQRKFGRFDYDISWSFNSEADHTLLHIKVNRKSDFAAKAIQLIRRKPNEKTLENLIDKGLQSLTEQIEKDMAVYTLHIDGTFYSHSQPYIFSTRAVQNIPEILLEKHFENLELLEQFAEVHHLKPEGSSFLIFNNLDVQRQTAIISSCLPLTEEATITDPDSNILPGMTSEQYFLKSTLKGDFKNISGLREKAQSYMHENRLQSEEAASPKLILKITHRDSKNPADWVTELYIPLQEISKPTAESSLRELREL